MENLTMALEMIKGFCGDYLTYGLMIFFIINLINVILSTCKSILTVKSTRMIATLINATAYGFYALVVKSMGGFDTTTVVVVTIVANLIGVYFSIWLLDTLKKDRLWKISVTALKDDGIKIANELTELEISRNYYEVNTHKMVIDIYSENQKESELIKNILDKYTVKYHITELSKHL